MDPPRPEAKQAIAECRQAGIVVKMITGDHQATASAIASELGLQGARCQARNSTAWTQRNWPRRSTRSPCSPA